MASYKIFLQSPMLPATYFRSAQDGSVKGHLYGLGFDLTKSGRSALFSDESAVVYERRNASGEVVELAHVVPYRD